MNKQYTTARTYGKALFNEAEKNNEVTDDFQELLKLRDVYRDVPELGEMLTDNRLSVYEKVSIISELESSFGKTVAKFIHMIYDYGRMDELPEMIDEFEREYYKRSGIIVARVTTAVPLSQEQRHDLENNIAEYFNADKAMLNAKIDPSIIGGVIIETEGSIIDQSIKTELENMHAALMK